MSDTEKEKDDIQEQKRATDEPNDEQEAADDDKARDDDTGARKVTFDSHDANSDEDTGIRDKSDRSGLTNSAKEEDSSESQTNVIDPTKKESVGDTNNMDLEDVNNDKDLDKDTSNKQTNGDNQDANHSETEHKSREHYSELSDNKGNNESISTEKDMNEKKEDTNTSEEKKDDGYVPLDKLWSSPKREYKGYQREYSFDYTRRTTSTSSFKEKTSENEQSVSKTEPQNPKLDLNKDVEESQKEQNSDSTQSRDDQVSSKPDINVKDSQKQNVDSSQSRDNQTSFNDSGNGDINKSENRYSTNELSETSEKHKTKDKSVKDDTQSPEESSADSKTDYNGHQSPPGSSSRQEHQSDSTNYPQREDPKGENKQAIKQEDDRDEWRFQDRKSSDEDSEEARSEDENLRDTDNRKKEEISIPQSHEDEYEEERFESESDDDISVKDTTQYEEEPKLEPAKENKEPVNKEPVHKPKEQPKKNSHPSPSPRSSSQVNRNQQKPVTRSAQPTSRPSETRRALSSAQMKSPRSQMNTPRSRQRPRTTPGGARQHSRLGSEEGRKRQKEFFRAELTRLQKSLRDESSKIQKPKQREHYPFVWTSLEPYYNTYVARFLIDAQEEAIYHPQTGKSSPEADRPQSRSRPISRGKLYAEDPQHGYVSRNTAIGLCDPWTDLRMDRELLPRLETPSRKSRTKGMQKDQKQKTKKEKPPKQGSTRLPKFPVVDFSSSRENATKCFPYSEVPKFRQEVMGRYKHDAPKKLDSDYKRTRNDFYRMDLDRLDEIHPTNRQHMRKAYFAYLQNTPGSKKAINECVKGLNGEEPQKAN
ncbi:protein starmaker-like isoform X4 [Ostrea edulis]|uniref:protein starmaker-like isoform X4 n=1 Tax=Ostrea edulis TaxID=37623 RepID=UPI0024AF4A43|nr:protein starmaker-like isoform X4 [Ostrea edulis]